FWDRMSFSPETREVMVMEIVAKCGGRETRRDCPVRGRQLLAASIKGLSYGALSYGDSIRVAIAILFQAFMAVIAQSSWASSSSLKIAAASSQTAIGTCSSLISVIASASASAAR